MKLPNGFGSIKKFGGNRRKPYGAFPPNKKSEMDNDGKFPSKKALGYFKTYQEAYECLINYSNMPFDEKYSQATFKQLYDLFLKSEQFAQLKESTKKNRIGMVNHCEPLFDMPVRNITKKDCQDILDSLDITSGTKRVVVTCMKSVSQLAMDMNLIVKDFTVGLNVGKDEKKIERKIFAKKEIDTLWEHSSEWEYKVMLMLLYSGMRVNELLKAKVSNVNLDEQWIYIEDAKNETSIRYVPIHKKVIPLYQYFINNAKEHGKEKLICNGKTSVIYRNYVRYQLKGINEVLGVEHTMHDTRHTFSTTALDCGIDEMYVQKIVGHTPKSVLMKTYNHIDIRKLNSEMLKFKY